MAEGKKSPARSRKTGGRYGSAETNGATRELDLFEVDAELLRDALANCMLCGDAIMLSLTQDQGAAAVRVMSNDQADVWYPSSTEALEGVLQRVRDVARASL